jgi:hypothetical protein
MPDAPNLILAYGRRAGEVAGKDKAIQKTAARQRVLADHMGADGTSICALPLCSHKHTVTTLLLLTEKLIGAAATSGKERLTMHLLACMLARI